MSVKIISQPSPDNERLSRRLFFGVVAFGIVLLIISALIHSQFKRTWGEVAFAALVLLLIQSTMLVAMFWGRKYWLKTGDPRLGFIVSGIYLVTIIETGTHFATQWRLIGPQDPLFYPIACSIFTVGWIILFSFRKVREKFRPTAVRKIPPK